MYGSVISSLLWAGHGDRKSLRNAGYSKSFLGIWTVKTKLGSMSSANKSTQYLSDTYIHIFIKVLLCIAYFYSKIVQFT